MIRIKLIDGETIRTGRYTYDQATIAVEAGKPLKVETAGEMSYADMVDGADPDPEDRSIYPAAIASIENVPA